MRKAIQFNRKARRTFSRFGFQPAVVGQPPWKDMMKAVVHSGVHRAVKLFGVR